MDRFCLTDEQWSKMEPFCLGKPGDPGRTGGDARLFVEAMLWITRTGSPWRDLPPWLGKWNSVYKRFRDWVKVGVFRRMFEAVAEDPDMDQTWNRHGRRYNRQSPPPRQGAKGGLRARPSATPKAA